MDKDRVKGKMDDAAGRAKRQVGEWTGDTGTQVEGAAQQVKGKAENAWGNMKDAARDTTDEAKSTSMRTRSSRTNEEERSQRKRSLASSVSCCEGASPRRLSLCSKLQKQIAGFID